MEHALTGTEFLYSFGIGILLSMIIITYVNKYHKNLFKNKDSPIQEPTKTIEFDRSLQASLDYFDNYLKMKFNFYLLNDLMAQIITDKEIHSKQIFEIKSKFFTDISTSLNEDYLENLAKVFTKPGLQLYIHQTFLTLFNKSQLQYKEPDAKKFDKRIVDAIMGE
jgi:hypothetical protein